MLLPGLKRSNEACVEGVHAWNRRLRIDAASSRLPKQPVTTDPFWADWCPRQRPVSAGPAINVCSPEARWRGRWRASDRVAGARDRPLSGSPTPTTAFRRVNR